MNSWSFHIFSYYCTNNAILKTIAYIFLHIIPQECNDKISPQLSKDVHASFSVKYSADIMFCYKISTPEIFNITVPQYLF